MRIEIKTVPHSSQRYATIGDWFWGDDGSWQIQVSELGEWRMELACAVHELVEGALCRYAGISQFEVDRFDMAYEGSGEPGDDPGAPYQKEHSIASGMERIVLALLGVAWKDYEERIEEIQHRQ